MTLLLAVGIVVGAISALRKPVTEQVNSAWTGFQAYIATIDINDYVSAETQEKLLKWQTEWDWQAALANPELTNSIKELLPKIGNWITGGLSWLSELLVVFIGFMYLIFLMIDFPNIRAKYSHFVPRQIVRHEGGDDKALQRGVVADGERLVPDEELAGAAAQVEGNPDMRGECGDCVLRGCCHFVLLLSLLFHVAFGLTYQCRSAPEKRLMYMWR